MISEEKRHRPVDFVLASTIIILVAIGAVMVFDSSTYIAGHSTDFNNDYMYFLKKQILWVAIGTVAMIFIMKVDYHVFKKLTIPLLIASFVCLIAVFAFSSKLGAKRWISIGFLNFQPSELAKYALVLYMAKSMDNKGERMKGFVYGMFPFLLVSGIFAGLVLKENNMSIASVIMIVTIIMLFVAGVKKRYFGLILPPLLVMACYFILSKGYRLRRVMSFLNPFADIKGDGYQLAQSLMALGSGSVLGVGIGRSRQKCGFLPFSYNDFIFSVIGEEFGIIGCIVVIILFMVFVWRGIKTAINAKDTFGLLLAVGITSVIAIQAIINIAVVSGCMPVTGVPLPFISYGGSSLVINMAAVGILLNISKKNN